MIPETSLEKEKTCPFCSYRFTGGEPACPPSCPSGASCSLVRCPRCGYHLVDEERSSLVKLFNRLFGRRIRRD